MEQGISETHPDNFHRAMRQSMMVGKLNLHLVSDATGETLQMVANASKTQFLGYEPVEYMWPMVRSTGDLQNTILEIQKAPGVVLCTLVNKELQRNLFAACQALQIPCVDVLQPTISTLRNYLDKESQNQPGRQHQLDKEYYDRINAMQFCLAHDDGQLLGELEAADIVLVGVSRTSKTPTCMYIANRGVKAANVPLVPGINPPSELEGLIGPVVVGLTNSVQRLVELRRNRLRLLQETKDVEYVNKNSVQKEVTKARRYFQIRGWPEIDVTGRSIEETAAMIMKILFKKRAKDKK